MPATLFDTEIIGTDGKQHHLKVGQAAGGGGSYQVLIDEYYVGKIVHYIDGWTPCLDTKRASLLYSDDIGAIVDRASGQ